MPPKSFSDGMDYENIAFHLWQGHGYWIATGNPDWQELYLSRPEWRQRYEARLSEESRSLPATGRPPLLPTLIACVYSLVGRGPFAFGVIRVCLASCLALAGAMSVAASVWLVSAASESSLKTQQFKRLLVLVAGAATLLLAVANNTQRAYATDFLTEPLAILLVQCWVILLLTLLDFDSRRSPPLYRWLSWTCIGALGVVLGGLILLRSIFVLWLPCVWLMLLLALGKKQLSGVATERETGRYTDSQQSSSGRDCPTGATVDKGTSNEATSNEAGSNEASSNEAGPSLCSRLVRWASYQRSGRCFSIPTVVVLVAIAVCSPWWIHNCWVLGHFRPLGTQGPITLLGGYNNLAFEAWGDWQFAPEKSLRDRLRTRSDFLEAADDLEREMIVLEEARGGVKRWIRNHWQLLPQLMWRRVVTHWNPYYGFSLLWRMLALIGAIWLLRHASIGGAVLLGLLLVNTLIVAGLYTTGGRFLVPLYGILFAFGGAGLAAVVAVIAQVLRFDWLRR